MNDQKLKFNKFKKEHVTKAVDNFIKKDPKV